MGDTLSEYLHIVAGTIIFASAMALFLSYMGLLGIMNKSEIEDMNSKVSVTMDTKLGYSEDFIYVRGSEVFADILSLDKKIPVTINGAPVDSKIIKGIHLDDSDSKKQLYALITMDGEYSISHKYYSNNEIKAVAYTRR